jgi:hypothetical protein
MGHPEDVPRNLAALCLPCELCEDVVPRAPGKGRGLNKNVSGDSLSPPPRWRQERQRPLLQLLEHFVTFHGLPGRLPPGPLAGLSTCP